LPGEHKKRNKRLKKGKKRKEKTNAPQSGVGTAFLLSFKIKVCFLIYYRGEKDKERKEYKDREVVKPLQKLLLEKKAGAGRRQRKRKG